MFFSYDANLSDVVGLNESALYFAASVTDIIYEKLETTPDMLVNLMSVELGEFPIPDSFKEIDAINMLHKAANFIGPTMKQMFQFLLEHFKEKYGTILNVI